MKHLSIIFDSLRALIYVVIGILVFINDHFFSALVPIARTILGITLILYGIFRSYQVYIKHFKQQDENV
jgi:hypothetical protein